MADNVTADPGSGGATFKTDEDTGATAHVPITKIELGVNNSFDGFVAASNPMPSQLTDGTNAISTAVEDAATPATINGLPIMMERDDALGTLTPIEGDWVSLRSSAEGALWTQEFNSDAILADTANIDTNVATLAGAVSAGQMQVDIVADGADLLTNTSFNAAFGTAGTPDAQVLSIQGITSMTPVVVDLGANNDVTVTSGTVTANAGTNLNTSALLTTAAHDAAFGTAGTADAQVRSVQGIAGMTPVVVDLGANNDVTVTGTVDLGATDNAVLDQIEVNTSYGDNTGNGVAAGSLRVTVASDSTGTIASTQSGTWTVDLGATDNAVLDSIVTNTNKGTSHYRNIDANAEVEIKGSAGTLHWIHAMNMTAAVAYLHLYDATAAAVTPGTTTPNYTFPIPTQGDTNGAGFNLRIEQAFANAITLVVTTTLDGSAGDPGTNGVIVNAGYT